MIKIGILALQGDFTRHRTQFERAGAQVVLIKEPAQLAEIQGLVIPGGESTTIGKLLERYRILEPLKRQIEQGFPVYGTCAGAILLAKEITNGHRVETGQLRIGTMDIHAQRNAYGRQVDSFEVDIKSAVFSSIPLRCVFIRAPILRIKENNPAIVSLIEYEDYPILIRQRNMLAGSFHPELTEDMRVQEYFLKMI